MERILDYSITAEYENLTIDQFLRQMGYSSQNLVELKKMPESILLNGVWEYMTRSLHTGDHLRVHIKEEGISDKIPAVPMELDIVYEDEDIMVLNKPADTPIHPSLNNYENSLANGLAYYFASQNKPFIFRCVNRLDRDTSGLTIIAKHLVSAGILSAQVSRREIHREYLAICRGQVTPASGTIDAPIGRKDTSLIERCIDFDKGESAITYYETIQYENGHSLLSIHLETGRTHQIRVHMKHLGYPLVGDYLYNPDMEFINRQALHSHRLEFTHPITREHMIFVAPLPEDMENILSSGPVNE